MFVEMAWVNNYVSHDGYIYDNYNYLMNEIDNLIVDNTPLIKKFYELKNSFTNECILLNFAIKFKIEIDKNGFYYINDEYNIYAYGKTQEEAENDVFNEFKAQYGAYVLENDNDLDDNAKILKNNLKRIYNGDFYA